MSGWLKLHRKITGSGIFTDPELFRLWVLCLAKASHKETTVVIDRQQVELQSGEFVTGRKSLTADYNEGLKPRFKRKELSVWRDLKFLEECGNVNIKSTNKYSVITIVKWNEYQESEQQLNNNRTTSEQQLNTNKNVKKERNKEKRLYGNHVLLADEEYARLVEEWGDDEVSHFIDDANYYFEQQPSRKKKYSNHNLMLRKWKKMDLDKGITRRAKKRDNVVPIKSIDQWEKEQEERQREIASRTAVDWL